MSERVYVLGGLQTDFARNWAREGLEIADATTAAVMGGLETAGLAPRDIQVAHVGNFAAELFCGQGHLGGLFAAVHPVVDSVRLFLSPVSLFPETGSRNLSGVCFDGGRRASGRMGGCPSGGFRVISRS